MPLLDVSFVIDDPMLTDEFVVTRRPSSVGANGLNAVDPFPLGSFNGVFTQQDPADIMRSEDGVMIPRRIFFATQVQLFALAPGYQPDLIDWNGTQYTLVACQPYNTYGGGTYQCIAEYRGPVPPEQ